MNHSVTVGVNRSTQVGSIDSTIVGDTHVIMVSPPGETMKYNATSITSTDGRIEINTGKNASIVMDTANQNFDCYAMWINATNNMQVVTPTFKVFAGKAIVLQVGRSSITITDAAIEIRAPMVKTNCS
jgi:type VI secretion system secreted protein VgrG